MNDQVIFTLDAFASFWQQILHFFPRLLIGILLMIVGWLFASLVRRIVRLGARLVGLGVLSERTGLEDILLKGGVQYSLVNLLANIVYWCLLFALTLAVLHSLGLEAANLLFQRFILYLPNIAIALFILVFGSLAAKTVRGAVLTSLTNMGISGSGFLATVAYGTVLIIVLTLILQQLSIGGEMLLAAFEIAFGGLCLALAIAFGLAGREWAVQILERLWRTSR